MSEPRKRAVAAGLSGSAVCSLRGALAGAGVELVAEAPDVAGGLRLIRELEPDVAVAGAVMPGMDGVAFAEAVGALRLNVRPAILLLRPAGLRLPGQARLTGLDAAVLDAPPDAGAIARALAQVDESAALPANLAARLKQLLDALGVPQHPGRLCLERAIALVWRDRRRVRALKDSLYPALARQTGLSCAQVERALRHVIDVAWRTGAIGEQHRIFGDTIDARRGKPTCGEMIAQLAEELRWEG